MRIARVANQHDPSLLGVGSSHTSLGGTSDAASHPGDAIEFDGSTTGLGADTVQEAIDELLGHGSAAGIINRHAHVVGELHIGDGSRTLYITAEEYEPDLLVAYVNGVRIRSFTQAATYDAVTFTNAPAANSDVEFDYPAIMA